MNDTCHSFLLRLNTSRDVLHSKPNLQLLLINGEYYKKKTFYTIEKQFHRLCPLCCESIASNYLLTRWHIQEPSVYLFIPTLTIIPIYHSFHERQFAIKGGVDRFVYFSINEPEDLWFCIRPKRKTRNCTFASKAKIYNYFWFLLRPLSFLFFVWIVLMIKINTRSTILFFNSDFKVFFFFCFVLSE